LTDVINKTNEPYILDIIIRSFDKSLYLGKKINEEIIHSEIEKENEIREMLNIDKN